MSEADFGAIANQVLDNTGEYTWRINEERYRFLEGVYTDIEAFVRSRRARYGKTIINKDIELEARTMLMAYILARPRT